MTASHTAEQSLRLSDERIAKLIELWIASNPGSMFSDAVLGLQELSNRRAADRLRPDHVLGNHAYCMSESHLSGYRLIVGFDTLEQVQVAHEFVAQCGKRFAAESRQEETPPPTADQSFLPHYAAHRLRMAFETGADIVRTDYPKLAELIESQAREIARWRTGRTGKHGSQSPCVDGRQHDDTHASGGIAS